MSFFGQLDELIGDDKAAFITDKETASLDASWQCPAEEVGLDILWSYYCRANP